MRSGMNVVVLQIDGLQAGYLGCYGNSWIGTPQVDRLASQSIVFDHALVDTPHLARSLKSCWQGWHALAGSDEGRKQSLAAMLEGAGVGTTLLTDAADVAGHPSAGGFDQLVFLDPPPVHETADEVHETQLARLFAAAVDWISNEAGEPFLLWMHGRGMMGPWDAPLEFRNRFVEEALDDEAEELPPSDVEFAARWLPEDYDPDEVLGIRRAYAGQAVLLDTCVGGLIEALDATSAAARTLLIFTSARGFPLGEHRRIGDGDAALHEELVHVPLMIRPPGGIAGGTRSQALVQPPDLYPTILRVLGVDVADEFAAADLSPLVREEVETWRQAICLTNEHGERAIRTPAWYLRQLPADELSPQPRVELYRKPDDRWEVNEVATRCPEVAESLERSMLAWQRAAQSADATKLPPLDEVLLLGID